MLHPGSQEVLGGSHEGPQKIHKQDYYIFLNVLKFVNTELFWLFYVGVLFRCALLVCFLCMLHLGSQEALEGSLEGPPKIHKQDFYNCFWNYSGLLYFSVSTQICLHCELFWLYSFGLLFR